MAPEPILVVDDDTHVLATVTRNLEARGYTVHRATTGAAALAAVREHRPAAVLLDLVLPDGDALDVLRRLRRASTAPVIALSVRGDEREKVEALDAGADDVLSPSFGIDELLARLRAVLRRSGPTSEVDLVTTDAFEIDLAARIATAGGRRVHLTPIEWGIVEVLVRQPDHLVTHAAILEAVWGSDRHDDSGYLRVHVASIRRKLEPEPSRPRYFLTEPRAGYRFVPR